jgi:hypothetical protein
VAARITAAADAYISSLLPPAAPAELAARRTAAAAIRGDFERESRTYAAAGFPVPDWATWAQRLSLALAALLDLDAAL